LIASQYKPPVQTSYVAAAKTLRLPYWDWAASSAIPAIVSQPQVSVFTPTGLKTFDNPLYRYKFPPLDPNGFPTNAGDGFLATTPYTIRDPNANAALASGGLTQAVYQLFSITDYPTFATQAVSGSSLESVHGAVHVYVGGRSGHMTYLSYSAFDPILYVSFQTLHLPRKSLC
jgi:tyrosinase